MKLGKIQRKMMMVLAETVANMPSIELTTKNIEKVLPENRKLSIKDVKVKTVPNVVIQI